MFPEKPLIETTCSDKKVSLLDQLVNASRRAFYSRLWSSGKIIVATNKIKKWYEVTKDQAGSPVMKDGKEVRAWNGEYERQGFSDHEYLWQLQLTHLYKPAEYEENGELKTDQEWGIRINLCKANRALEGTELWGSDACFQSLVKYVYPTVPISEWGF